MPLIEVDASRMQAAGRRLQGIQTSLAKQIQESTKTIEPEFQRLLSSNAKTKLERKVIGSTGKAVLIEDGIRLEAGKAGDLAFLAGPVEYGANRGTMSTYKRRGRKTGTHTVRRHTTRQFRKYKADGYLFGPAVKAIVPKLAKAWTEALEVSIADSIEG